MPDPTPDHRTAQQLRDELRAMAAAAVADADESFGRLCVLPYLQDAERALAPIAPATPPVEPLFPTRGELRAVEDRLEALLTAEPDRGVVLRHIVPAMLAVSRARVLLVAEDARVVAGAAA